MAASQKVTLAELENPPRATLTELQNRALSAGIPSESVRVALNAEDPHQKLLNLLLKQLHEQYVEASNSLDESDEWKLLSIVPPQAAARRELDKEPLLKQRLERCVDSKKFEDFPLAQLQELAVGVGAERQEVADIVDAEPDESRSRVEHMNDIKSQLASIILKSQTLLQQSMLQTRALPSAWGGDREVGYDMLASYQISAVETADEEFGWLMEQQKIASAAAYQDAHRMRDKRHAELLDKIRAATDARDTVVKLQELSRQQQASQFPVPTLCCLAT